MKTISKKCQPPYFEQILNGTKRFEIRLNDNDYAVGDTLLLKEYIPKVCPQCGGQGDVYVGMYEDEHSEKCFLCDGMGDIGQYTGREVARRITSIVPIIISHPTRVFIDGNEWWSIEEIEKHGLAVLGLDRLGGLP